MIRRGTIRGVRRAALHATLLAGLLAAAAAPRAGAEGDADRTFVESLRRDDPTAAETYLRLRDARQQAMAEARRAEERYQAAGPELRPVFLPELRKARRAYVERSIALLDFLEARDRAALAAHQEAVRRINAVLEEHKAMRAQLERLLKEP